MRSTKNICIEFFFAFFFLAVSRAAFVVVPVRSLRRCRYHYNTRPLHELSVLVVLVVASYIHRLCSKTCSFCIINCI